MRHLYTLICDDLRSEVGQKVSLMGVYNEEITLSAIPSRLPKLSIFQRWVESPTLEKVDVELRGTCLDTPIRVTGRRHEDQGGRTSVQIMLPFFGLAIVREGTLEFATYINDDTEPRYVHALRVKRAEMEERTTTAAKKLRRPLSREA